MLQKRAKAGKKSLQPQYYIEFSGLTGRAIIEYTISLKAYQFINMFVKESAIINITHRTVAFRATYSHLYETHLCAYEYSSCYFQYTKPASTNKHAWPLLYNF